MGAVDQWRSGLARRAASFVTGLSDAQREIATILFGLAEARGFVLAGGSALVALGAVDRETRDIDAFVQALPTQLPGDVTALAAALSDRLRSERWTVDRVRWHLTFVRLIATKRSESVEVDLAVDSPLLFPPDSNHGLPVMAAQDLAARKVLATLDRVAGRDFTDLKVLSESFSRANCVEWAMQLDRGIRPADIANSFSRLDLLSDDELPCPPDEALSVRKWFSDWGAELADQAAPVVDTDS